MWQNGNLDWLSSFVKCLVIFVYLSQCRESLFPILLLFIYSFSLCWGKGTNLSDGNWRRWVLSFLFWQRNKVEKRDDSISLMCFPCQVHNYSQHWNCWQTQTHSHHLWLCHPHIVFAHAHTHREEKGAGIKGYSVTAYQHWVVSVAVTNPTVWSCVKPIGTI